MIETPSWLTTLELPMPATLGSVNLYLICGTSGVALIDTGMNDAGSRKALECQLKDRHLELSDIDIVVFTHHHVDHAGLGQTFMEAGARTMMSAIDARSLQAFFAHPELDATRATFNGCHEMPEDLAKRVSAMFPFFRSLCEQFKPQVELQDGQKLDLGGIELEVMVTPGHTPGHICLKHDDGIIFTGDCVTPGDATHVSMRPEVIGTDPLGQFLCSLERICGLDAKLGLPGHGAPIGDLSSRAANIISHHQMRLEQVVSSLDDEPKTAFDLSVDVMGSRPRIFARWLAMSQILAYLEHLVCLDRAHVVETERGMRYRRSG